MHLNHLWNLIFNRKKFKQPAKISLANVIGFLQGNTRALALQSKIELLKPPVEKLEQAYWRLGEIEKNSPECLKSGQCQFCGCSIDEKIFDDRGCEDGCYPMMKNYLMWEYYKKDNNLKIELK